ncbi:FxsA family protein [Thermobifida halotolerans]|uniref:FxsA family protein n=1 Tax=Thermobifida halotolerans TaxID=483545 RepID=A0A399G6D9_9ACTN|nr:FxsA family protein [Thermobifida halotolerans]UOE21552.1 FxsA family protein [Thermobifida halotolerans]
MPLLILIALMALPFLEIWLMILVGSQIGATWTIASLCALSVVGVLVARRAGRGAYADAQQTLRTGTPLGGDLVDTLMLLAGGVLLAVPGFLTALLGALMALPFTRPALRWLVRSWARRHLDRARAQMEADLLTLRDHAPGARVPDDRPGAGRVIQGRVIHDDESEQN